MSETPKPLEDRTREDVAELKGEMRQLNQRVGNIEQTLRQMQGSIDGVRSSAEQGQRQLILLVVGTWITTMLTILLKG